MEQVVNWSQKRQKHVVERMMLRGISRKEFHEAVARGRKRIQKGNITESIYRYYSIVYEEIRTKEYKKVYPITVKVIR
jgi:hypothetical protein